MLTSGYEYEACPVTTLGLPNSSGGRTTVLTSGREEARRAVVPPCPVTTLGLPRRTDGRRTTVLTSGREEAGRAVVPPCPVTTLGLPRRTEEREGITVRYLHLIVRRRDGRRCRPVP
jgi:hypothetical protein